MCAKIYIGTKCSSSLSGTETELCKSVGETSTK